MTRLEMVMACIGLMTVQLAYELLWSNPGAPLRWWWKTRGKR